jgi:hypothetical protein
LIGATWSSETSIIGSGWLFGALFAAQAAGPAAIAGWLIGGIAIVILALVHAELQIHALPVLLGQGVRLFEDHVAGGPGVLEPVRVRYPRDEEMTDDIGLQARAIETEGGT